MPKKYGAGQAKPPSAWAIGNIKKGRKQDRNEGNQRGERPRTSGPPRNYPKTKKKTARQREDLKNLDGGGGPQKLFNMYPMEHSRVFAEIRRLGERNPEKLKKKKTTLPKKGESGGLVRGQREKKKEVIVSQYMDGPEKNPQMKKKK